MKNTLQAIYLKIDTTSKSLAKNALSQLILKILFHFEKDLSIDEIKKSRAGENRSARLKNANKRVPQINPA